MADEKLRSLELVERIVELASRNQGFWRHFGRVSLPTAKFQSLMESLIEELPVDIKKARDLIAERGKIMDEAIARSEKIIDDAAEEAGKRIDEHEIMTQARKMALTIRDETDNYVIEALEKLEDEIAALLKKIKGAQTSIIADMERRQQDVKGASKSMKDLHLPPDTKKSP